MDFSGSKSSRDYKRTADNLFTTDVVEALLGISEGPIKGLKDGAKSFYLGDTPLVGTNGKPNFESFNLKTYLGNELGEDVKSLIGGFGASTQVGVSLTEGVTVTRSGTHQNIDYIDLRFIVQTLVRSNNKGEFTHTGKLKLEYKRASSSTWLPVSSLVKVSDDTLPLIRGAYDIAVKIGTAAPPTTANLLYLKKDQNYAPFMGGEAAPASQVRVWVSTREPMGADQLKNVTQQYKVWVNPETDKARLYNGSDWVFPGSSTQTGITSETTTISAGEVVIEGKTTSGAVQEYRVPVDNVSDTYDFRVTVTAGQSGQDNNFVISWDSLQEITAKAYNFPGLAVTQVAGRSSDQLSSLPELSGVYQGRIIRVPANYNPELRTYSGTWNGAWKLAYSNNPAYIGYDLVTNDRYGMASYYPIDLNKWDVYEAGKWCDVITADGSPRFTFNGLITDKMGCREAIQYIFGILGARFFDDGNGQAVLKLDTSTNPVAVFAPENVIDGVFNYSFTGISTQYNDVTVNFVNPDLNWQVDKRRVYDQAHINKYGRIPKTITAVGCTSVAEAIRRGKYQLVTSLSEKMSVSFKTNRQGLFIQPYDIILIADPYLNFGWTGRVGAVAGTNRFSFRDPIYLENGYSYQVTFLLPTPDKGLQTFPMPLATGQTGSSKTTLTVQGTLPAEVGPDTQFSIGRVDTNASPKSFRVMSITPEGDDDDNVSVDAIEVNRVKWDYVDGLVNTIPVDVTGSPANAAPLPVTSFEVIAAIVEGRKVLTLVWSASPTRTVTQYKLQASRNGDPFYDLGATSGLRFTIPDLLSGDYLFSITPVNRNGVEGAARYTRFEAFGGDAATLPLIGGLTAQPVINLAPDGSFQATIKASWTPITGYDGVIYDVSYQQAEDQVPRRTEVKTAAFRSPLIEGNSDYFITVSARVGDIDLRAPTTVNVRVPGDDTIPPAPTGWVGIPGYKQITLRGDPSGEIDFKEFVIYGANASSGPFTQIAAVSTTEYIRSVPNAADLMDYYRVTQKDRSGNESPPTATIKVEPQKSIFDIETDAPEPPSNLRLSTTVGTLTAVWDASPSPKIAYYEVEYTENGGNPINLSTSLLRHEIKVLPNASFVVRVRAVNHIGLKSPYTNSVSIVSAKDTTPPAVPTGLTIKAGFGTLWGKWNANTESDLSGYEVYVSSSSTNPTATTAGTYTVAANTVVLTGLDEALTQYFWVRAFDTSGNKSAWCARQSGTTSSIWQTQSDPAVPTALSVSSVLEKADLARVTVTWTGGTNNNRFEVGVIEDSGNEAIYPAGANRLTFTTLPNRTLSVRVLGINVVGKRSAFSAPVNHTVAKDTTPPAVPTGLVVTPGFNSLWAKWDANTESDFAGYEVYVASDANPPVVSTAAHYTVAATTLSLTSLPEAAARTLYIRAFDTSGNRSAWTDGVSATTASLWQSQSTPAVPTALTATSTVGQVEVTWTAGANNNSFELGVTEGSGNEIILPFGASPAILKPQPGTALTLRVRGLNSVGNRSAFSATISHTAAKDTTPPAVPTGLSVTPSFGALWIRWAENTEPDLAGYELYASSTTTAPSAGTKATAIAQGTSATISGLGYGILRYIWVRAFDTSGNKSAWSARASGTTPTKEVITANDIRGVVDSTSFAAGIEPVTISTASVLPITKSTTLIFWGGKQYRWDGSKYIASTDAADIAGQLTDAQIAAIDAAKLTGQIGKDQISDGSISGTKFASGLTPVEVLSSLPAAPHVAGRVVFLTSDSKLYRNTGSGWEASVSSSDITGQVQAAQIAGIEAAKITGKLTDTQIEAVAATKVTGELVSTQLAAGAVSGDKIATGAVDAIKLAVGAVTGPKIAAAAVGADQIAANAIVASKLAVMDSTNLILDGDLQDTTSWHQPAGVTLLTNSGLTGAPSTGAILYNGTSSANAWNNKTIFVVTPGDDLFVSYWTYRVGGTKGRAQFSLKFLNATGGSVSPSPNIFSGPADPADTFVRTTATVTVPANAVRCRIELYFGASVIDAPLYILAPTIRLKNKGELIVEGAITTDKLAAGSVVSDKLAANAVTAGAIAADAVTADKLAANAVTARNILAGSVSTAALAAGAVTANELAANSVVAGKLAANAVTAVSLAADAVTAGKVAAGAINTRELAADAVTANRLAADAVTARSILAGSVSTAALAAGAVTADTLAANAVTTPKIAAGAVTANELSANSVVAGKIAVGAVGADQIVANAITASKLSVMDLTNLIPDPEIQDSSVWHVISNFTVVPNSPVPNSPSKGALLYTANGSAANSWNTKSWFTTTPGDDLWLAFCIYRDGGTKSDVRMKIQFRDATGTVLPTSYEFRSNPTDPAKTLIWNSKGYAVPDGAVAGRIVWYIGGSTTDANVYIMSPSVRLRNKAELIVDGAIKAQHLNTVNAVITGSAQIATGIINDAHITTLNAGKLTAGSALAGSITVSGKALTAIKDDASLGASDPAGRINDGSTLIDPGKILISGSKNLGHWRDGGDQTRINGGVIAANTVKANSLEIGSRNITLTGLTFEHNKPVANSVSWTSGAVRWINDEGVSTSTGVAAGSAAWTSGTVLYIYWPKGATSFSTTTSLYTAMGADVVCFATYEGGIKLDADFGRVVVDGEGIKAGTVTATQMIKGKAILTESAQIGSAIITDAHIVDLDAAKLSAGSVLSDSISVNGRTLATINGDFMLDDTSSAWKQVAGIGSGYRSVTSNTVGVTGGSMMVAAANGVSWWESQQNIPFDPKKLYRVTFSIKRASPTTGATGNFYLGLTGLGADKSTRVNTNGDDAINQQHYMLSGAQADVGTAFKEYVFYLRGNATAGLGAGTIANPKQMHPNVRYLRPLAIFNYNLTEGGSQMWLDSCRIEAVAEDGVDLINAGGTNIDPGKIAIFGTKTLADWRSTGDLTKIDGGHLSANSVATNKLTVGNRQVTLTTIAFEHNRPNDNDVFWSGGSVRWINDAGNTTTTAISAGSASWTGGVLYIYWVAGEGQFRTTTNVNTAVSSNTVCFATYEGGIKLDADYGRTVIDGSSVKTGTITATQMVKGREVITESAQIKDAVITTAHVVELDASKLKAGSVVSDSLVVNGRTLATINGDFLLDDTSSGWTQIAGSGTGFRNGNSTLPGQTGGSVMQIAPDGVSWWESQQSVPFDPKKLYKITFSVRHHSGTTGNMFLGVTGLAADKTKRVNINGEDSFSNQHYVVANSVAQGSEPYAFKEYIAYVKGNGTAMAGAGTIASPKQLHPDVRFVRPMAIFNHNLTTGGCVMLLNSCRIEVVNEDVADLLNAGETRIDPGKITIYGTKTLDSWRRADDQTRIDGGAISANTISANKLEIGSRNTTLTGVKFEHNRPANNQVFWSGGTVKWVNDAGNVTTTTISAGSGTWTSGVVYIYWEKGASNFSTTTNLATAMAPSVVCLATYEGDTKLDADYGRTVVDGSDIKTATITATQLIKTENLITSTAQLGTAVIRSANITDLEVDTIKVRKGAFSRTWATNISNNTSITVNAASDDSRFIISISGSESSSPTQNNIDHGSMAIKFNGAVVANHTPVKHEKPSGGNASSTLYYTAEPISMGAVVAAGSDGNKIVTFTAGESLNVSGVLTIAELKR